MTEAAYIKFVELNEPKLKTKAWAVVALQGERPLGRVSWYGGWRKYVFMPEPGLKTIFEERCLRDISDFIERETAEFKRTWKRRGR